MISFAWVDYYRGYSIAKIGLLEEGQDASRKIRLKIVVYVNVYDQMVDLEILQPVAAAMYYATYSADDCHN